jgi:hypothetical protein
VFQPNRDPTRRGDNLQRLPDDEAAEDTEAEGELERTNGQPDDSVIDFTDKDQRLFGHFTVVDSVCRILLRYKKKLRLKAAGQVPRRS